LQSELRVFKPEQEFGAERGSSDGRGNDGPTQWRDDRVWKAAAECEVDEDGDDIGERFEEEVRMD